MNQHQPLFFFFIVSGIIFTVSNCTYNKGELPKPSNPNISYNLDVKPILIEHCYKCHTDTATNPDRPGYAFFNHFDQLQYEALTPSTVNSNYTTIIARLKHIESPGMPFDQVDPLPDSIIQKIQDWVLIGAPEN